MLFAFTVYQYIVFDVKGIWEPFIISLMRFCILLLAGLVLITILLLQSIPQGVRNANSFLASSSIPN